MSAVTITFGPVAVAGGRVRIQIAGTKRGVVFDGKQQLRDAIREALQKDREHQMLLAIYDYVKNVDPTLSNPAGLQGRSFTADNGNG